MQGDQRIQFLWNMTLSQGTETLTFWRNKLPLKQNDLITLWPCLFPEEWHPQLHHCEILKIRTG